MLCAGTYKMLAGYPRNDGMELGMINPWWGYWGEWYRRLPPTHWTFRTMNHLAYGTEVVAALLMLFPPTQVLGALLILLSFVCIAAHIRLGLLWKVVMLSPLVFLPAGPPVDRWLAALIRVSTPDVVPAPAWLNTGLTAALVAYVVLLPLAKIGQYYNFLARKSLTG